MNVYGSLKDQLAGELAQLKKEGLYKGEAVLRPSAELSGSQEITRGSSVKPGVSLGPRVVSSESLRLSG